MLVLNSLFALGVPDVPTLAVHDDRHVGLVEDDPSIVSPWASQVYRHEAAHLALLEHKCGIVFVTVSPMRRDRSQRLC